MRACVAVVASGVLVFGCGSSMSDVVSRRATSYLNCPEVHVIDNGGGGYDAIGCGQRVAYVCSRRVCAREGEARAVANEDGPSGPRAQAPDDASLAYVAELAAISESVEACSSRGEALVLTLRIDAQGRVVGLSGDIADATEQSCIETHLARVYVESLGGRESVVTTSFPPPHGRARAATVVSADGWLEGIMRTHGPAIVACAGRSVVAVRVSASQGAATWSLQGDLSGSPEEECVRSVVAGEAPPAGVSGTWVRIAR